MIVHNLESSYVCLVFCLILSPHKNSFTQHIFARLGFDMKMLDFDMAYFIKSWA